MDVEAIELFADCFQLKDISDSGSTGVEELEQLSILWLQERRAGVEDGVELLEGGPEPELGLLWLDSPLSSPSLLLWLSSDCKHWQISSGRRWYSSSRLR